MPVPHSWHMEQTSPPAPEEDINDNEEEENELLELWNESLDRETSEPSVEKENPDVCQLPELLQSSDNTLDENCPALPCNGAMGEECMEECLSCENAAARPSLFFSSSPQLSLLSAHGQNRFFVSTVSRSVETASLNFVCALFLIIVPMAQPVFGLMENETFCTGFISSSMRPVHVIVVPFK